MQKKEEEKNKQKRDLRLLTCSADDYALSEGKDVWNYELRGVSGASSYIRADVKTEDFPDVQKNITSARKKLMDEANKLGAEVVTDLRFTQTFSAEASSACYEGTALVLRKKAP